MITDELQEARAMKRGLKVLRVVALGMALASMGMGAGVEPKPGIGIDHIMIGVPDLDRTLDQLAKMLGVRPVYGGKHPRGTHNALLSLGERTYLEFIALQPGVAGHEIGMDDLVGLTRPVPLGWAVGAPSTHALTAALASSDLRLSEPEAGSRTTPAGEVLRWQTLGLETEPVGAPFFIVWSPDSHHPSTSSPQGCKLVRLRITGPDWKQIGALCSALTLPVEVLEGPKAGLTVALDCPNGPVTFQS